MQLSEKGMLDLHEDVNRYLEDFQVPDKFDSTVTLAHLMTHTPGFEEQELGVFVAGKDQIENLGSYLKKYMPVQMRPAGLLSAYSNYGTALAAYIVERVSGLPFHEYVRQNIYMPLTMNNSSFLQPPAGFPDAVSRGYFLDKSRMVAGDFEWIQAYPAGSMSSTADDIAKFMIAHLNKGAYGDARILSEATAKDMHERHFAHDERVNGWTRGFMELNTQGYQILWHGGDTYLFHSAVYLFPELGLGIFVSYNCPAGAKARIDLLKAFMAKYLKPDAVDRPEPVTPHGNASLLSGSYLDIRTNFSTPEKLMTLLNPVDVVMINDHTLLFGDNAWIETEPMVFRNSESMEILVFRKNEGGRYVMFRGNNPTTAYIKLSTIRTPAFQKAFIAICFILFVSAVLLWPLGIFRVQRSKSEISALSILAGTILWLGCAISSYFIYSLYRIITQYGFSFGLPDGMHCLLNLSYIILFSAVILFLMLFAVWKRSCWTPLLRYYYSLIAVFLILFTWWLGYWNLIFFHFPD